MSDSARRRQQARMRMSGAAQNSDRNLRFASQSRRHPLAHLRVKRAAREKERKAPMVNLPGHHQEVERRLQPNGAQRSHNTERSNQRKERRRRGHNNSGSIICSRSGKKNSGAAFFVKALVAVAAAVSAAILFTSQAIRLPLQQFGDLDRVQRSAFEQLIA